MVALVLVWVGIIREIAAGEGEALMLVLETMRGAASRGGHDETRESKRKVMGVS